MVCLLSKDGSQDSLFPSGVCSNWYVLVAIHWSCPQICSCRWHYFCLTNKDWNCFFFLLQLLECPSIYELLANSTFQWEDTPYLQIWRQKLDTNGKKSAMLESYEPDEAIKMIREALSKHEASHFIYTFTLQYNLPNIISCFRKKKWCWYIADHFWWYAHSIAPWYGYIEMGKRDTGCFVQCKASKISEVLQYLRNWLWHCPYRSVIFLSGHL